MTASEIVAVTLNLPDDWYDVDLDADDAAEWIGSLSLTYDDSVDTARFAGMLASLREALLTDDVDVAAIHLDSPNRGNIGAVVTLEVLERGADDTPESFLAFAESQRDLRSAELDISAFQSWTAEHPFGDLVAFTCLALVTAADGESILEERAVYTLFPTSTAQIVQITFRTARLGVFEDIAGETAAMVANMELELEPA
ncbi:hypothetical protein ACLRGF_04500 [Mycetocola zhadangensis]|uniref:hypothetical protein n=1 Tax=Mycetocola zhadangensis TaxID=1164595 RepID=UPI003A4D2456